MLKNRAVLECVARMRDLLRLTQCSPTVCSRSALADARASQHIKFDSVRTVFSHKEEEEQALCVRERAKHVRSILPALKT